MDVFIKGFLISVVGVVFSFYFFQELGQLLLFSFINLSCVTGRNHLQVYEANCCSYRFLKPFKKGSKH